MNPLDEVRAAVSLAEDGRSAEARELFHSLWDDALRRSDALAECIVAHHLADLQDDRRKELRWDILALAAAERVTDGRASAGNVRGGRLGLYPSLHLNLAEDYLELGDREAARESVRAAGEHLDVLPDDAYGRRIRAGFARLEATVEASA